MISKKNRSRLIPILNLQARIKNKSKKKRRISMTVLLKKNLVEYDENGNRIPHLGPYDRSVFLYFKSHLDKSI
jgi:hypothetical protein